MPRGPRLDAPGVLHHVIVRSLEGSDLFREARDREDLVHRLDQLIPATGLALYAWALLPNHFHLLVRTGPQPLARCMRSLLTGYVGAFNRRHTRSGHLVQNRYRSIVVEEEPYLLELVRYIHLNPLRAGVVPDLAALAEYPFCGHAALLGRRAAPWQAVSEVLGLFGGRTVAARARYEAFVAAGVSRGRRSDLQGGGLVRSHGGWTGVKDLRRGRESYTGDERVLGSSQFVETLREELEAHDPTPRPAPNAERLVAAVCASLEVSPGSLHGGGRSRPLARARQGIAYLWSEVAGQPLRPMAPLLGVSPQAAGTAARVGREDRSHWMRIWKKFH